MVQTFLDEAFGLDERAVGFSDDVEDMVEPARSLLWEPGVSEEEYREAREALERALAWPMSPRQRAQAEYVLAMTLARLGKFEEALAAGDRARELAAGLRERLALARLLEVRARWLSGLSRLGEAAEAYEECVAALEELEREGRPVEARDRLRVVAQSAGVMFYLGRFDRAEELLEEGRRLLAQTRGADLEAAALEGTQAQLYVCQGQWELALRSGSEAAEAFARLQIPDSEVRARVATAEAAMRWAGTALAERAVRDDEYFLGLAHAHLQQALEVARAAHDGRGEALAWLGMARYRRLRGLVGDPVDICREVALTARLEGDVVLEALALHALGDELAAMGYVEAGPGDEKDAMPDDLAGDAEEAAALAEALRELPDSAMGCWRAAQGLARAMDLPALWLWPERALRWHEEMGE